MKLILLIQFLFLLTASCYSQNVDSLMKIDGIPLDGWITLNGTGGPTLRFCKGRRCNGLITDTFPNGNKKYEATFINGKPYGQIIRYYPNGEVKSLTNHEYGVKIYSQINYYEGGKVMSEYTYDTTFTADARKSIAFYENGTIEDKYQYGEDNFLLYHYMFSANGDTTYTHYPTDWKSHIYITRTFHPNGQLSEVQKHQYSDGKWIEIGIWKFFDVNGNLINSVNKEK